MTIRLVRRLLIGAVVAGLVAVTGCSSSSPSTGGGSSGNSGNVISLGTTDTVTSFDPAEGYSPGDSDVMDMVYQGLLTVPIGQSKPALNLASACGFTDPKTYWCTIKQGVKFSNGQTLTTADVKYSFVRNIAINNPIGDAYELKPLQSISLEGSDKVVFHLKVADATWPDVLSTNAALIVPQSVYPAHQILADAKIVGSGPYKLEKYVPGQLTALVPNPYYSGPKPMNGGIDLVYYTNATTMSEALKTGSLDAIIAWRSLTPTDLQGLKSDPKLQTISATGVDGRYLNFNVKAPVVNNVAIRQAIAYLINRTAIAQDVFQGVVRPLYSLVPQGIMGSDNTFEQVYGQSPNPSKAAAVLKKAGIKTPVALTLWYTPTHYGNTSADEYAEIQRDLGVDGLFNITLKSTAYTQYESSTSAGAYQGYQAGWYPDYGDPDDYLQGLLEGGWPNNYSNATVSKLLAAEESSTSAPARQASVEQVENIVAQDVPIIPIYQTNYIIIAQNNVSGIKQSLNLVFQPIYFQYWAKS